METFQFNCTKWIRIALINFFIVALAGMALRYKINFPLPLISQKHLLHGHSHFAFIGWGSLAFMALMVNHLQRTGVVTNYKKYHWLLLANTLIAYGMLVTFILQGYALSSITFSTLSIFVSYYFCSCYWKDLKHIKDAEHSSIWFKSALILWVASSLGPFTLAYLMAHHVLNQNLYFSAIYFYLHFQYNGWFIFASLGLLFSLLKNEHCPDLLKINRRVFLILGLTVAPTYLLSILGIKLPNYLFWFAVSAGLLQLIILFYCFKLLQLIRNSLSHSLTKTSSYLWTLVYVSYSIKIILQGLSIFPYFSHFAFGFRPVIIGYLHLCFLGVISFFLLGYFDQVLARKGIKLNKWGLLIFISGVMIQELVLMVQALDAIWLQSTAHAGIILFFTAVVMVIGLSIIVINYNKKPL